MKFFLFLFNLFIFFDSLIFINSFRFFCLFLVSNCPCLNRDIDRIQAILEATAVKLYPTRSLLRQGHFCGDDTYTSYPNNYFGYGRVDVLKAVQTCREFCADKPGQWLVRPQTLFSGESVAPSSSIKKK